MQLSKRLLAVASMVTPGNRVADVGCDHAYTSIYLVEHGITDRVIAMDVNQGPIDRAKENIEKYGYVNKIETRKSNGLEKLLSEEVQTILIAGMGGGLTLQILEERQELVQQVKELILQPQSEINKVRIQLQEWGYVIDREDMVKDEGKFYMMLRAVSKEAEMTSGQYELTRREHFYYGRQLLEERHPVLKEFLLWEHELAVNILKSLRAEQTENARMRGKEIEERIAIINCGLEYYKV